MADEDEIDILGDFSFNSCLAQNNQGIPSCSSREDTVHPQWLLDSVSANWYDTQRHGPSRRLTGTSGKEKHRVDGRTSWSEDERQLLVQEMEKYGRNIRKISQTIKSKTEAEIQALIEAEHGVHLDTPSFGLRHEDSDDIPTVAHEEIVTEEIALNDVLNLVTTASPTVPQPNLRVFSRKVSNTKHKTNNLSTPNLLNRKDILNKDSIVIDPSQILYDDDLMIGSTESIGSDLDPIDSMMMKIAKQQKAKVKKLGNHRRKVSRNFDGGKRNKSKELKSPGRQRKDSSVSDDSTRSPKMQIVLGSGQALLVSEGEQVIKIEKKQGSESESDIEIDIDSDYENDARGERRDKDIGDTIQNIGDTKHNIGDTRQNKTDTTKNKDTSEDDGPIAVPLNKFERIPRRQKKINLDGDGGYTITHTAAGDVLQRGCEPKRERARPRAPAVPLIHCAHYSNETPPPLEVRLSLSALLSMDAHAHSSRAEVMGLIGGISSGSGGGRQVSLTAYRAASAAAGRTHCDMDPVSQAVAAEHLSSANLSVVAWHHSHPQFPPEPSALDLVTQRALQRALESETRPLLGVITSQHWGPGRTASRYRCIRIENPDEDCEVPTGYQFSVKLVPDVTPADVDALLDELRALLRADDHSEYSVDVQTDKCPQAGCTYLEKFISSTSHHLQSAGYAPDDGFTRLFLQSIRDVFR